MPYPMIIPQYSPVMMAGGGFAAAQPPMMPVAKALANQGRMTDSTLVHMNPQEVAGLQSLARQNGTSLTINPQTGLPEAFNLSSILPVVAGAALTPVLGPVGAAMAVGGLGTLMSGSIEQGLMMGLGAYGGAGLAGSAANLAAPAAAAASAPTTAAIAAPSAMGTTGIMASGAPATTLAGATQFAPAASVGGVGFQAPALSTLAPITPATTAAAGSSLVPTAAEVANLAGAATGSTGISAITPSIPEVFTTSQATAPFATAESIADVLPSKASSSISPPSGIGRLFQPDERTTYENIGTGLKKAFSSGESAMDFLGQNKMNLAMSAAPMLLTPEQEEEERRRGALISPYEYRIDNLSGTDVDPFGTEAERLRGRFVAKTPYYAAKGGLMSLAEGGSTSGSTTAPATTDSATTAPAAQTPSSLLINLSPAEAEVYRNIFATQQMSGSPLSMPGSMPSGGIAALPNSFTMSPIAPAASRAPAAYTPSMVGTAPALDTSEKSYSVFNPVEAVNANPPQVDEEPLSRWAKASREGWERRRKLVSAFTPEDVMLYNVNPHRYPAAQRQMELLGNTSGGGAGGGLINNGRFYSKADNKRKFAEGGSTSESKTASTESAAQTPSSLLINLSPAEAEVYRNIFAVQQMAGVPLSMPSSMPAVGGIASLPSMFVMSPSAATTSVTPVAYTPSMVGTAPALDTSEKSYSAFNPVEAVKATSSNVGSDGPKNLMEAMYNRVFNVPHPSQFTPEETYRYYTDPGLYPGHSELLEDRRSYGGAKGGLINNGRFASKSNNKRKKVSRSDPFYEFGLDMSKIAEEQFAGGGMTGYAYDPMTNSYKMAGGGLTSLKAGGLREGAFIVPADVISHLGNGSSEAGMKIVQERLKGRPIKGPGDGMSDSIPTTIGGKQPARVANEEAEIPPEVVAALGNGSMEKGAKKLYEMMDKIRQDRTGKKKQAPAVKADKYMPA